MTVSSPGWCERSLAHYSTGDLEALASRVWSSSGVHGQLMYVQLLLCTDNTAPQLLCHRDELQRPQVSFRDLHCFHMAWERIVFKRCFCILRETDTP